MTIVAAAAVAFALASYRVVTSDLDVLLTMVPDDAFYYLQIARHLAAHGTSTFDGVSTTNGYHPLWMAILTALATIVEDRATLLRWAIALSFSLHAVVAVLVSCVIRRFADDAWGWIAAVCWLINPLAFSIAITTTEAAIYALAAVTVLLAHLSVSKDFTAGRLPAMNQAWRYGGALGLLCLARTEGLIVAALALAWMVGIIFWKTDDLSGGARRLLACGAAIALIISPWWLFSLAQVGTIVQDSGAMKMLWATDNFPTTLGRLENVREMLGFFARRTLTLMTVWNYSWRSFAVAVVALATAPVIVTIREARSSEARTIRTIVIVLLALTAAYGMAFAERQIWWLTLPCLATVLLMFTAFPAWLRPFERGSALADSIRVALALVAIALFVRWHVKGHTPYPWQPDVRRSQLAIELVVPAPERIGCFNAGIPAFFGSGRVVGLDGLVNHAARLAWSRRRLDEFVATHDIRYIADEERIIRRAQRFSNAPISLAQVASYPLRGWPTGKRYLWRVR